MEKGLKICLIAIVVLIVLTPLGLIATGTAFGEWNTGYLMQTLGYIPSGLGSMAGHIWHAPLDGYNLPGQHDTIWSQIPGYYISAIVGIVVAGSIVFIGGKLLIRNKDED
jgi:hypothetical protein